MALLNESSPSGAIDELTGAVSLSGYEYSVYRLALARAYLAAGQMEEAMAAARQSAAPGDPSNPRLDLQLDRVRAMLVLAQVQAAMKRPDEAVAAARQFLARWHRADAGHRDLLEARRLASTR